MSDIERLCHHSGDERKVLSCRERRDPTLHAWDLSFGDWPVGGTTAADLIMSIYGIVIRALINDVRILVLFCETETSYISDDHPLRIETTPITRLVGKTIFCQRYEMRRDLGLPANTELFHCKRLKT